MRGGEESEKKAEDIFLCVFDFKTSACHTV